MSGKCVCKDNNKDYLDCHIVGGPNNGAVCVVAPKPSDPFYDGIPSLSDLIPFGVGFIIFLLILSFIIFKLGKRLFKSK